MKKKEELISRIVEREEHEHYTLRQILEEELEPLNPYKIDEERMVEIYRGKGVTLRHAIHQYNSTLPEPLQPLPSEMPSEFSKKINELQHGFPVPLTEIWEWVVNTYGTPKREWWEYAAHFVYAQKKYPLQGYEVLSDGSITLYGDNMFKFPLSQCTPLEPVMTADDVIKAHNLSDAEVKAIREG